jgi:formylglycine-generating enzyme required for sulfatase activity
MFVYKPRGVKGGGGHGGRLRAGIRMIAGFREKPALSAKVPDRKSGARLGDAPNPCQAEGHPFPEIRAMLSQTNLSNLYNRVRTLSASLAARLRCLAITAAMGLLCTLALANPPCPADLDGDGEVSGADISLLLLNFGPCPVDPPVIDSVTPSFGPTAGGTTITILGSALEGATGVTVRGVAATSVTVVSETTVTAVTPPGALGAANVQVITPGGTATLSGGFTYGNAPPPPSWCTVLEQTPNATVVFNSSLRAAITATNLPWRVRDNGTGIEMVLIPPGTYTRGCSASNSYGCNSDESPTHQVTLTQAFYLSRTEVTQAQWVATMGNNPSSFQSASSAVPASEVPNRPVEQVSWNDIQPFCTATGMRLPTEAEWEYAYRAGTTTAFHGWPANPNGTNDDNQLGTIAWFYDGSCSTGAQCQTRPVGGKAANGFGLFDMSGNVWEWCQDWYGTYASGAQTNPTGPGSGIYRVLRGGFWRGLSYNCRASLRNNLTPVPRVNAVGFRVARTP